jgi:glucuronoarabinoxylan endo-1,4-beta-xylanase
MLEVLHLNRFQTFVAAVLAVATGGVVLSTRAASCIIDWNEAHQRIDGFGGGVVFLNPASLDPVTSANMDTLFLTNIPSQLGLTLIRIRIDSSTNWSNGLLDGSNAMVRGTRILATPWSPPAGMKSNNNIVGGSLLTSQYGNYANYLNGFAAFMKTNGAPLAAISIQNEPDASVTYESCVWTPTELQAFCHTNARAITNAPVLMPESESFNINYSDPTLNDPVAVTNVDLIGGHLYGVTTIQDYPNAHNQGKPTWMTEYLVNDQSIDAAIATAQQIHDCLTVGNMSAYIWWKCLGDANGLVNASGVPQIRGFVMAQFSRFVRPGFNRIGVTSDANATSISAYKDTNSLHFAIIAINTNSSTTVNQTFILTNFTAVSVTPWITSASQSLAVQSPVTVSNATFTYALAPQSIVTFVGQMGANTPPVLAAVANQTINAGTFLTITNVATDTNQPAQTLTFALLSAPAPATLAQLNNTNAIFTWRPLVSQADTTNQVTVQVSDGSTPVLSATNSFTVVVNPLVLPTVSSIAVSGGQAVLTATGTVGPDYTLWASTNLLNWQALLTSNSPALPVSLVDPNFNAYPTRFYRIRIGP